LNLFTAVFLPMFMAAVDQTLLATATPAIADSIGGLRDTSWIAVAYLLASATVVPAYGRLGDQRGRREMLLVALAIFTLGSVGCGIAQTFPQLVIARVVQGLGGGGLMTLTQALIGEVVPPRERPRFQGYFAIVFTSASVGGPVLGGLVVSHLSWRWLFLANLPFAVFAAWRLLRLRSGVRHTRAVNERDVVGLMLFAIGALSGLFWLTAGGHHFAWRSTESGALLLIAVAALGTLSWYERRHRTPFLPIDLLRAPPIRFSVLTVTLFAGCMFAMIFYLPIYLQLGHHLSAIASGVLLLPLTAGMVVASISVAQILRRSGDPKPWPIIGMSVSAVALLLLGVLPPNTALVVALGFVAGMGFGTVMPISQMIGQTVAGHGRLGAVTSMISLARSTGAAIGAALFGALAFALVPGDLDIHALLHSPDEGQLQSLLHAFHKAFLLAAAFAALAAVSAVCIPRIKLWPPRKVGASAESNRS
jgi:EmrB/QacA subfamily drug resistance transporter